MHIHGHLSKDVTSKYILLGKWLKSIQLKLVAVLKQWDAMSSLIVSMLAVVQID